MALRVSIKQQRKGRPLNEATLARKGSQLAGAALRACRDGFPGEVRFSVRALGAEQTVEITLEGEFTPADRQRMQAVLDRGFSPWWRFW